MADYRIHGYGEQVLAEGENYFLILKDSFIEPVNQQGEPSFGEHFLPKKVPITKEDYIKFNELIKKGEGIDLEGKVAIREYPF